MLVDDVSKVAGSRGVLLKMDREGGGDLVDT